MIKEATKDELRLGGRDNKDGENNKSSFVEVKEGKNINKM